ncbi:hypothetical protein [Dyadobacter aurulentus]|uniref:hypothetical protein n=1 Tax=Dyadobacter sp. UC 10 TaxID=2605428 RepID=UPI0011F1B937|nr:hypothetical protein [Dyadobacter sp. UC 10]KAA0990861.1 hypothetical protein FXO21_12205 [Dyadobacter sp. UC 10]
MPFFVASNKNKCSTTDFSTMNLVQKLPIGLGLACMMMLSSCSKEDVSAPEPQVGGVNESSGLREETGGVVALPVFPSTIGATGFNIYPAHWKRVVIPNLNALTLNVLPTGTSTSTHLWGNASLPWTKAIQAINEVPNGSQIVTVTSSKSNFFYLTDHSAVKTTIKNLKPGKKYSLTFYVASTHKNVVPAPFTSGYAKEAGISLSYSGPNGSFSKAYYVDLNNKEAVWVSKTIIFDTIGATEVDFGFACASAKDGEYSYANIFVDKNSIKEVN